MEELVDIEIQDDLTGRYLTFYIENIIYSLPLNNVIEIISIESITHIPGVPNYVKGIVNLRGKVVPISDVRLKFGHVERPYDEETCIVIVIINDMNIGLIVDKVAEVVSLEKIEKSPASMSMSNVPRYGESYLDSISTLGGRVVMNIDIDKFFQADLENLFIQQPE